MNGTVCVTLRASVSLKFCIICASDIIKVSPVCPHMEVTHTAMQMLRYESYVTTSLQQK